MENNNYEITTTNKNKIVLNNDSEKKETITTNNKGEIYDSRNTAIVPSDGNKLKPRNESKSGLLVINKQELNSDYVKDRIREEKEAKIDFNKAERIPVSNNIFFNPIFYTTVCGLISAVIAWGCVEPYVLIDGNRESTAALTIMVVFLNVLLCTTISGIDGLMSGNLLKMLKNGAIGLGCGLLWGFIGGRFLANLVMAIIFILMRSLFPYMLSGSLSITDYIFHMIARSPAWAFMGMGIGAIPGIANSSSKMIFNGIIGGILGGFIGGFLFDPISYITHSMNIGAGLSRGIGFACLAISTSFFVGLVENMAKDVWITMKSGPLRGKQFVIYHNPTFIGSSPKSDIYIFKDPDVMPTHAKIIKKGSKYEISEGSLGSDIYVNSEKINGSKILEANDTIIVGQSILEFQQREKR